MSAALSFEEHGEVLAHWHRLGWSGQTVVCLDRHLDLKRIADDDLARLRAAKDDDSIRALNRDVPFRDDDMHAFGLDDFVYAAGAMGMVKRFVWVVPPGDSGPDVDRLSTALWKMLALVPGHGREILYSFRVEPWGARADVGELSVAITTVDALAQVPGLEGAELDVDLDYFCDEEGHVVDDPARVATKLRALGLAEAPPTMTFSISSGFMPPALRYLGETFAGALGWPLEAAPQTRRHRWAAVEAISGRRPLDAAARETLWKDELCKLGGAGWSARCLLELGAGQIDAAMASHDEACALGDRATWPAYALGLHLIGRNKYGRASAYLERAAERATDTISAHAHFLRAMCAYRLGELETCARWAEKSIALTPMWRDAYVLGAAACRKLHDEERAEFHDRTARTIAERQRGAGA